MIHKMRRFKQELPESETVAVLKRGTSGVLALSDEEGFPYAVPLSYAYEEGRILFHCAPEGHKLELIEKNNKCSFAVIDQDQIVPEEYTTYYRSVIAFGSIRRLEDPAEKRKALETLSEKYSPGQGDGSGQEIDSCFDRVLMLELQINHMTGKAARELVKL